MNNNFFWRWDGYFKVNYDQVELIDVLSESVMFVEVELNKFRDVVHVKSFEVQFKKCLMTSSLSLAADIFHALSVI